jgi:hypothetical protein
MTVKGRLHQVVDEMSEQEAEATLRRIESRRNDPLLRFLDAAPLDDEPVTPEEEAAIAEVEADRASGAARVPFDDVKRKHA